MPLWLALILGAVQGLTEFLPVSSSGHLALLQNLFNIEQYGVDYIAFDVVLHLGTLLAVCIAFWDDIVKLVKAVIALVLDKFHVGRHPMRRMVVMLVIATLPMAVAAILQDHIAAVFEQPLFIGIALCVTAALLYVADRTASGRKTERNATYGNALLVGLMQLFAVIPGISRSGSTMCGGLFAGFDRDFAVRFAFLLSIPAVLGASVVSLPDLFAASLSFGQVMVYLAGFVTAVIFGYLAIKLVKLLMKKNSFRVFSVYCLVVGVASIIWGAVR